MMADRLAGIAACRDAPKPYNAPMHDLVNPRANITSSTAVEPSLVGSIAVLSHLSLQPGAMSIMPIDSLKPAVVFGRRGQPASKPAKPSEDPSAFLSKLARTQSEDRVFIVRYNWKIAAVGISLLGMTYKAYSAISAADHGWDMIRGALPLTQEVLSYAILGVGMGTIGLLWLSCFILRVPALTMNMKGVKGFTLLGSKYIAWEDIEYVKIEYHYFYKEQITIRASIGSPTGGYFLHGIPLKTAALNRSRQEIVEAIRIFVPNIIVTDTSAGDKRAITLAGLFSRFLTHNHR